MKSPFSDPFDNLLFVGDDLPDNCVSSKPLRFFFFKSSGGWAKNGFLVHTAVVA